MGSYDDDHITRFDRFCILSYFLEAIFLIDLLLNIFKQEKNPFEPNSTTSFSFSLGKETCASLKGIKKYLTDHFWDILAILPFQFMSLTDSN